MFYLCEDQCCQAVTNPLPLHLTLIDSAAFVCSHRKDLHGEWLPTLLEHFFCFNAHIGRIQPCGTKAAFVVCAVSTMNMNLNESCSSLVAVMV